MLWPLIVGIAYLIARKPRVSNLPGMAFLCIVVGYVLMAIAFTLTEAVEKLFGDLSVLGILLVLLAPVLATHFIFRSAVRRTHEIQ
jgi:hypothetical protein